MLSPDTVLAQIERLFRNTANPPDPETFTELCADWMELFGGDLDDAGLRAAVTAHLKRSKFWPTPAELLADAPTQLRQRPEALRARAELLFPIAVKARASTGRSEPDRKFMLNLAHYADMRGVEIDDDDVAAIMAAVGDWRSWDPGDPLRGSERQFGFARRDFGAAFGAQLPEARSGRLSLPAPPDLKLLSADQDDANARLARMFSSTSRRGT